MGMYTAARITAKLKKRYIEPVKNWLDLSFKAHSNTDYSDSTKRNAQKKLDSLEAKYPILKAMSRQPVMDEIVHGTWIGFFGDEDWESDLASHEKKGGNRVCGDNLIIRSNAQNDLGTCVEYLLLYIFPELADEVNLAQSWYEDGKMIDHLKTCGILHATEYLPKDLNERLQVKDILKLNSKSVSKELDLIWSFASKIHLNKKFYISENYYNKPPLYRNKKDLTNHWIYFSFSQGHIPGVNITFSKKNIQAFRSMNDEELTYFFKKIYKILKKKHNNNIYSLKV